MSTFRERLEAQYRRLWDEPLPDTEPVDEMFVAGALAALLLAAEEAESAQMEYAAKNGFAYVHGIAMVPVNTLRARAEELK